MKESEEKNSVTRIVVWILKLLRVAILGLIVAALFFYWQYGFTGPSDPDLPWPLSIWRTEHRFKQMIHSPIPEGIYDINGGCAGSMIDVWAKITFRYKDESSLSFLKSWTEHDDSYFTKMNYSRKCEECRHFGREGNDYEDWGELIINTKKLEGEFYRAGCPK